MKSQRLGYLANKRWFVIFSIFYASFVGLPFLAPILMKIGVTQPAEIIYSVYQFLCHQLPQRSFFLNGEKTMYSLAEIQSAWQVTVNPFVLREFIGTAHMGWKVAWSDRMVSMYTSVLFVSWIWYPLRSKMKKFPIWVFLLFLLPMAVDGTTHMISDFSGIGQGFRDDNLWLAQLTNMQFPESFYVGDSLGSINSWIRLLSGLFFGIGVVLFGFPYIGEIFEENTAIYENEQQKFEILRKNALEDIYSLRENKSPGRE